MKCFILPAVMLAALSIASPVASAVSDSTSNNDDGDCVCYGSVATDRNLLTHRAIQEKSIHRSLREVEAIRKKHEEALRVLQGEEDDCECVEVCDDDNIRDDDGTPSGKKGKGSSGKGTSSGKKGKGSSGKGTPDDDTRDDDGTPSGKKGKGSSGKGTTSGKKSGKGDSGRLEDDCVCECYQGECKFQSMTC